MNFNAKGRPIARPHLAKTILIMKLTTIIFIAALTNVSAKSYSQIVSIHQKRASLEKILTIIQKQTGYHFLYDKQNLKRAELISVDMDNVSLEKALAACLKNQSMSFKVMANTIVLRKNEETENLVFKQVNGTVTDLKGLPLPGVSVKVKNTPAGTVTDPNGKYAIEAPDNAILVFSFIGFKSQEIPVGTEAQINVKLAENMEALSEVVVVGYGTQRKEELTSAVSNVKAKDFNQGGARSPMDLIQGKVAGLTITRAGGNNPNSGASIQLRGVTSLSGDRSPLIVIDGIPGGNLDLLQQDDIESMSVLKDGSAAAIYGTRANGGVILVTTKKGKKGPASFDYSTYFSRDYLLKKPDFYDAAGYRGMIAAGQIAPQYDHGSSTDFYRELLDKDNFSQYHNLALSGGGEGTTYRASIFYNDLNGIAKQNGRQNYGTRLSITQTGMQDKLTAQVNLATNTNKANLLGEGTSFESALVQNPTDPIYNADGSYYEDETYGNQIARLNQQKNMRDQQTTSADAKISLSIVKGLKASIFGALQRNSYVNNVYYDRNSRNSIRGSFINNGNITIDGTGYAQKASYLAKNLAVEPTLEYTTVIAKDHNLNAIAGYSYQYNNEETFFAENAGFPNDVVGENNLESGSFLQDGKAFMDSQKEDNKLIAFFGRVNYNYKDKYLLQLVMRREGSSRFGANHKWGNFPAASIGWNITKESFMENIKVISNLKLRAGYGVTGNQGIGNYLSLVTLGVGNPYVTNIAGNGETWAQTYGPSRNPNPDLRWEKKKEVNIGLDFGLFDNKVTGTLDVYKRKTTDLLENYNTQLPPFIQSQIYTNVGSIENSGIELGLSSAIIKNTDFSWNTTLTASNQKNKMGEFSNDLYNIDYIEYGEIGGNGALGNAIRTFANSNLGDFFGKRFAGFTPEGDWQFYKADGSVAGPDDMTDQDKTVIGNGIPKYYASWTNNFTYKNFDLTVFFRGKFGYDILNTTELSYGNKIALPNNVLQSANNANAQLNGSYQYSDYYLENGNFVKLDNVTLGYNWKPTTKYIRNLRIYASAKNLGTITGYKGVDPEVEDTGLGPGIDGRGTYPRTRTFTVGLNVGF
jgi:TonB-linked SusC/RagA family outer membrane protein